MALSTKVTNGGDTSNLPKTLSPGFHKLKLNKLEIQDFKYLPGAKHLYLHFETEPIEGFTGFKIDNNNPELGNYQGQVARVKAGQYAFANGKTKTGIEIDRDQAFMIFMKNLCEALGITEWYQAQDEKFDTLEELVEAFNETAPFQDVYLDVCISGKEYLNNSGYTAYDMWLSKPSRTEGYSFSPTGSGKTLPYNENLHLIKLAVTDNSDFEPVATVSKDEFGLD